MEEKLRDTYDSSTEEVLKVVSLFCYSFYFYSQAVNQRCSVKDDSQKLSKILKETHKVADLQPATLLKKNPIASEF